MRRFAAIALLSLTGAVNAQTMLTPQSFVTQMKANGPRVSAWSKVYEREGQFRQVFYAASVADVDVVPAQSLLRPYHGKAKVTYSSQQSELLPTAAEAAATLPPRPAANDLIGECELMFVPGEEQWQLQEARCRSTVIRQWTLFDREGLIGKPLGDMLAELDAPVRMAVPKALPPKKR